MTETELLYIFADNLKCIMDDNKINQSELARMSNISRSSITKYLKAQRMPSLKTIVNLCCVLKCDIEDLVPFVTSPVHL